MRFGDVSPALASVIALVLGAATGALATKLADVLPGRYEIAHVVTGPARTRRNVVLVALSALLAFGVAHITPPDQTMGSAALAVATHTALGALLLAASAIDLEHMILPDEITFGGALVGLATAHFRDLGLIQALAGGVAGLLIAYVPFLVYKRVRGVSGMGVGDAKLLLMIGAWQGWQGALFVMFAGAAQSVLAAVVLRVTGTTYRVPASVVAELEDLRARAAEGDAEAAAVLSDDPMAADVGDGLLATRLPLGPFLALGALELLFARTQVLGAVAWLLGR